MPWPIHEKIQRLLRLHNKRKKDLALHLQSAPQTMTDICKGRSAVTLRHLRGLMSFFGLRADYWLDDGREEPDEVDHLHVLSNEELRQFKDVLRLGPRSWNSTLRKLRSFIAKNRSLWNRQVGQLGPKESKLLGLSKSGPSAIPLRPKDESV
ncbi:MAG: hypothetical protein ACE5F1_04785 [Planctomycetota bacterium]